MKSDVLFQKYLTIPEGLEVRLTEAEQYEQKTYYDEKGVRFQRIKKDDKTIEIHKYTKDNINYKGVYHINKKHIDFIKVIEYKGDEITIYTNLLSEAITFRQVEVKFENEIKVSKVVKEYDKGKLRYYEHIKYKGNNSYFQVSISYGAFSQYKCSEVINNSCIRNLCIDYAKQNVINIEGYTNKISYQAKRDEDVMAIIVTIENDHIKHERQFNVSLSEMNKYFNILNINIDEVEQLMENEWKFTTRSETKVDIIPL